MNAHASRIVDRVSEHYGITREELLGPGRSLLTVEARHVAMLVCRRVLRMSYPELGRAFGKDHTTCINAVRKAEKIGGLVGSWIAVLESECMSEVQRPQVRKALPEIDLPAIAAE